ncbi:MAG: hypothetical protein IJ787_04395 [Bacilli bacterium]|nr:hypothetical protein [Bacilli bacterium]
MRVREGKKKDLSARECRVLAAVSEVAKEGFDGGADGIAALLRAELGAERFTYLRTYGCLQSCSKKRIKSMTTNLVKKGYLQEYSPPPFRGVYLLLTPKGEAEAEEFLKNKNIRRKEPSTPIPLFNERK